MDTEKQAIEKQTWTTGRVVSNIVWPELPDRRPAELSSRRRSRSCLASLRHSRFTWCSVMNSLPARQRNSMRLSKARLTEADREIYIPKPVFMDIVFKNGSGFQSKSKVTRAIMAPSGGDR
ncbi:hypothetical protein [Paraburkholderia gardini]|uniref:hypothetical protein n=1 Tax=Paraburkholderia gardini TaxID=2823469 RepID=UPI001E4D862F|nr:hypothetical protein [Paraburkholderia gardini]